MRYILMFIFLWSISTLALAEIAVVVNSGSSVGEMNEQQISNLFLSKTNRLSNGEKAIILELKNSHLRSKFYRHITNKTVSQLRSYWTTLIFTGKGKPPKSFVDNKKLVEFMSINAGAIAYLNLSEVTRDMKIVYRFSE